LKCSFKVGFEDFEYIARSLRARYEKCTGPVRTEIPTLYRYVIRIKCMASKKFFKGLVQNISRHSRSYLSYLHPHLGNVLRVAGLNSVTLSLLEGPYLPNNIVPSKELELAISAWRKRFCEMADKTGAELSQLSSATVYFDFGPHKDLYYPEVKSEFIHKDGTIYKTQDWEPPVRKPENRIPDTNLDWPDQFLKQKEIEN